MVCEGAWDFPYRPEAVAPDGAARPERDQRVRTEPDKHRSVASMNISNENNQADRAISTGKLHALLHFHTQPINVVVFHDPDREYSFSGWFPA